MRRSFAPLFAPLLTPLLTPLFTPLFTGAAPVRDAALRDGRAARRAAGGRGALLRAAPRPRAHGRRHDRRSGVPLGDGAVVLQLGGGRGLRDPVEQKFLQE